MTSTNTQKVSSHILTLIKDEYHNKLNDISTAYNIPLDNLINDYPMNISKLSIQLGIKKRNRRVLNVECQCMGRKLDGGQCTRSKKGSSDFCLSHQKGLPQGRIDEEYNFIKKENKKKKEHLENNTNYQPVSVKNINGQTYLINLETKIVYTYDLEAPTRIGFLDDQDHLVTD